jgi:flagellar basal body-associated protein FliL
MKKSYVIIIIIIIIIIIVVVVVVVVGCTRWRSWLRHCAISPKTEGSFPDEVTGYFY